MAATTRKEGALAAPSDPASIDTLRKARTALLGAIRDGAGHLRPVLAEVEDALIDALARRRREGSER